MLSPDFFSQTAASLPFDNIGSSFVDDNTEDAIKDLRKRNISSVTAITTSLNGTTAATNISNSLYFFTGTATGHKLDLPNATTCTIGHKFEVWNLSNQILKIRDFTGADLIDLRANAKTDVLLTNNSTSAGLWQFTFGLDNGNIFGTNVIYVVDETETSNNSGTTWATKLTLNTPSSTVLGTYLLSFQFIWRSSLANREADFRFRLNSANIVAWSPSTSRTQDRQLLSGFQRVANLSGSNTFDFQFKWIGSSTTIFVQQARMFLWRIG